MSLPIPELPIPTEGLPPDPAELVQQMIPDRVVQVLMPELRSYVDRITIKTAQFGAVPAATLTPLFVTRFRNAETGAINEVYLFVPGPNQPDAFMDITKNADGSVGAEIARCCYAQVSIYVDGNLVATFPEITVSNGPWIGYAAIPIEPATE